MIHYGLGVLMRINRKRKRLGKRRQGIKSSNIREREYLEGCFEKPSALMNNNRNIEIRRGYMRWISIR